jgi:hypothetical protein
VGIFIISGKKEKKEKKGTEQADFRKYDFEAISNTS